MKQMKSTRFLRTCGSDSDVKQQGSKGEERGCEKSKPTEKGGCLAALHL